MIRTGEADPIGVLLLEMTRRWDVSLLDAYDYRQEHGDEIDDIDRAFELKSNDDGLLCSAALVMLGSARGGEFGRRFVEELGLAIEPASAEYVREHKRRIASALLCNRRFQLHAINFRGMIARELEPPPGRGMTWNGGRLSS